jgi:hypothetical protein
MQAEEGRGASSRRRAAAAASTKLLASARGGSRGVHGRRFAARPCAPGRRSQEEGRAASWRPPPNTRGGARGEMVGGRRPRRGEEDGPRK